MWNLKPHFEKNSQSVDNIIKLASALESGESQSTKGALQKRNRPFPSALQPQFQGESTCEVFDMNVSFHSHSN